MAVVKCAIVPLLFPRSEIRIDHIREFRSYKIVVATSNAKMIDKIQDALNTCELKVSEHHKSKIAETIVGTWQAIGSPKNHENLQA